MTHTPETRADWQRIYDKDVQMNPPRLLVSTALASVLLGSASAHAGFFDDVWNFFATPLPSTTVTVVNSCQKVNGSYQFEGNGSGGASNFSVGAASSMPADKLEVRVYVRQASGGTTEFDVAYLPQNANFQREITEKRCVAGIKVNDRFANCVNGGGSLSSATCCGSVRFEIVGSGNCTVNASNPLFKP